MSLRGFKPVGEEVTRGLEREIEKDTGSKYRVEQFNTDDGLVTKVTNPNRNRIAFIPGNISRETSVTDIEKNVITWLALDEFKKGNAVKVSGP